jgi:uncharacterized protein (TIGR02145 family)
MFSSKAKANYKIIAMQTLTFRSKQILTVLAALALFFQSCQKDKVPFSENAANTEGLTERKRPKDPSPPPPVFYFTNCNNPTFSASFAVGVPTNTTITKNYVNSPGGSYPAFTSGTVNGITITAPAGTFNAGSGSIVFTATGTPVTTGFFNVWIGVGSIQPCMMFFTVANAPATGPTIDPGSTVGSTGVINFNYRGQSVAYKTVRAADGKIWLQQNMGSPQVAFHQNDEASYGDYFQWGRWDDGHQAANSPAITGGPSLINPSNIPSGNSNFIKGTIAGTKWWSTGGLATDTWSGSLPTSTNGKDPCVALGAGWRLPTAADWQNLKNYEDLEGTMAAFMSTLKLPAGGFRSSHDGLVFKNGDNSNYWSATAAGNSYAMVLAIDDNTYSAMVRTSERGQGYNCRCVKD